MECNGPTFTHVSTQPIRRGGLPTTFWQSFSGQAERSCIPTYFELRTFRKRKKIIIIIMERLEHHNFCFIFSLSLYLSMLESSSYVYMLLE